jgi:cysteine desulfurase/selenocysteine lyase
MTPNAPDWSALREDFPILDQKVHGRPLIYFDNAATSQKPRAVIDALVHYYERDNANVHRGLHELSNRATVAFEAARVRAAKFLNARSADEIIFTRGTTEGINLVAAAWGTKFIKRGDKILLTEIEHHSNIVPWQLLAERTGAQLVFLPINGDPGLLDLGRLDEFLTSDVKLLAITHISNSLGTINPVAEYCERARRRGIVTLIDAAQSAGHCPIDVQQIGCDFLALSAHKMCGPTGFGVLYGRGERLEETPPYQGGGEMILSVDYHKSTWKDAPHKFEAGTPDISGAIGLHAAMDYLDRIGRDRIAQHAARPGTRRVCVREAGRAQRHPALRPDRWPGRSGELPPRRGPRARRGDGGRPARSGVARRASLQPAAHEKARRGIHGAGEFLFLQHDRRNRPLRRTRP